jgi:hypothetical protein
MLTRKKFETSIFDTEFRSENFPDNYTLLFFNIIFQ